MKNKIQSMEENPNGLHRRYNVTKVNGESIDEGAEYFVLRLDDKGGDSNHIDACRKAIIKYADCIEEHLPELANDLYNKYGQYREIYCPVCDGCGIDGCCSSLFCENDRKGIYCESYFNGLKDDKEHLNTWMWFMHKYHENIYDDFYKRLDSLEEEEKIDKLSKIELRLNDEGDEYAR